MGHRVARQDGRLGAVQFLVVEEILGFVVLDAFEVVLLVFDALGVEVVEEGFQVDEFEVGVQGKLAHQI